MPTIRLSSIGLLPTCVLLCCALLPACARDAGSPASRNATAAASSCLPRIRDGWVRLVPGGEMPMDAGYARIENPCATPAVVVGGSSLVYADVSLHQSMLVGGVSRMRPVGELRIPAGDQVTLQPGAMHLMLMAPRARPKAGDHVAISLQLQDGRRVDGVFEARALVP